MEFRIRRAVAADARPIAHVHVESWRSTYAGLLPNDFLASLNVDERANMWAKMLATEEAFMFVAEDETGIFGFACGGKAREARDSYDAELYAIYLLRESQRRGAGCRLFRALTRALRTIGYSGMVLWVLKNNPAVKFYERMGGKQIAIKPIEIGGAQLEEVAFGWPKLKDVIPHEKAANGPE
ncbi:MAG: N-acetyltransferase family protein [Terracidiphilus sp.]